MITTELLREIPSLAKVPDDELAKIAARAADVTLRPNDWLIQEGELPAFSIVLSGRLAVNKTMGGIDRQFNEFGPGELAGTVPLLLGSPSLVSIQATEVTRLCQVEPGDFRSLIAECPALYREVLDTMTRRVTRLQKLHTQVAAHTVTIIGHRFDIACHDVREFLAQNHVPFQFHDVHEASARAEAAELKDGEAYPVVVLADGRRLVTPSLRELAEGVGLTTRASGGRYDLAIIGAGPAGLAAAVYGASEGLRTILLERQAPGGQAGTSSKIENYLGFPTGVSGDELGTRALTQARRFGAEILVARQTTGIEKRVGRGAHQIVLDDGERIEARSIVIASGVDWRKLDVARADELTGRGVYYGAARTEVPSIRDRDIFMIGGGNSAGQAAMHFAGYARKVTLLVRGESLADSMSQYLIARLEARAGVSILFSHQVVGLEGSRQLEAIVVEDRSTGAQWREATEFLFAFIGADARTDWMPEPIIRDQDGYVCTGRDVIDLVKSNRGTWPLSRDPFLLETSVPGVFAAGDVRHGSIKRVASGVGEGSMAIAFVHQYLASDA
jgi:thioredoxin reductase (NADPH)